MLRKITVNKDCDETTCIEELRDCVETYRDDENGYFIVESNENNDVWRFDFVYMVVLGCRRLFVYDPINDSLEHFDGGDFHETSYWLFDHLTRHFRSDYNIWIKTTQES